MISCQSCGHESPLGATFCRGCGKRLVVDFKSIEQSVQGTRVSDHDQALLSSGRSALLLCTFALMCALIARYVVVPPMPATVPPPSPVLDVFLPPAPTTPTTTTTPVK